MYNSDLPSRADLPTTRQLLRSTLIAVVVAAALLITVVLPAEYGIDPTGIGRLLGLSEMGNIKQQLQQEALRESAAGPGEDPGNDLAPAVASLTGAEPGAGAEWRDVLIRTLAPAEGLEIKLTMRAGDRATYEWSVDHGHLNSDLHTDDGPEGKSLSYRQGRAETSVSSTFTAASDGAHGWFWRNRSGEDVTVTLRLRGDYRGVKP